MTLQWSAKGIVEYDPIPTYATLCPMSQVQSEDPDAKELSRRERLGS